MRAVQFHNSMILLLIDPTSLPPASPMAIIYSPIWVWKPSGQSVGTLQTCPELPLSISNNFHFSLFELIFAQFQLFLTGWDFIENAAECMHCIAPALQMAVIYRPICVLMSFRKSVRTMQTRSELLLTISNNFQSWVFGTFLNTFSSFQLTPAPNSVTSKD